uniref:ornithine decarboxylase-like isoform X1 n=1 Tax=Centroberyx gerrardi TaxID=166262 RepID=UPI003AADA818
MAAFSPEQYDMDILGNGKTVRDFIDNKIKEHTSVDCKEPFHVANLGILLKKHLCWLNNLPRVKPFYAVKCNNTPAVIRMLSALGTGFDCSSQAEIQLALSLGVTPDEIIYAHTCKPEHHIKYAATHGVQMMTFDNQEELSKIAHCHANAKLVLRIAVDDSKSLRRLNSKFGADLATVGKLLERAGELGLEVIGVSFHVGCECTDSSAYRQAIADARHVFDIAKLLGFQMSLLDIGGGFPGSEDVQVKFEEISAAINLALDEFFPLDCGVQIIAEPGRYYMESLFTLAVNVIAKKVVMEEAAEHNSNENIPDRVMMYYINDGVYGSMSFLISDPVHRKLAPYLHRTVESSEQRYRSVIWGPTCDSMDKITDDCSLPELQVGDWLLFDNMGAYTVCLSTDFNGFEKAHIYSVVTPEAWQALIPSHTCSPLHD